MREPLAALANVLATIILAYSTASGGRSSYRAPLRSRASASAPPSWSSVSPSRAAPGPGATAQPRNGEAPPIPARLPAATARLSRLRRVISLCIGTSVRFRERLPPAATLEE